MILMMKRQVLRHRTAIIVGYLLVLTTLTVVLELHETGVL